MDFGILQSSKDGKKKSPKDKHKDKDDISDNDSDLDLSKDVKPIVEYIRDREVLVEQMFKCMAASKLSAMLPDILKVNIPSSIKFGLESNIIMAQRVKDERGL